MLCLLSSLPHEQCTKNRLLTQTNIRPKNEISLNLKVTLCSQSLRANRSSFEHKHRHTNAHASIRMLYYWLTKQPDTETSSTFTDNTFHHLTQKTVMFKCREQTQLCSKFDKCQTLTHTTTDKSRRALTWEERTVFVSRTKNQIKI